MGVRGRGYVVDMRTYASNPWGLAALTAMLVAVNQCHGRLGAPQNASVQETFPRTLFVEVEDLWFGT